jgi:hypothetical protein
MDDTFASACDAVEGEACQAGPIRFTLSGARIAGRTFRALRRQAGVTPLGVDTNLTGRAAKGPFLTFVNILERKKKEHEVTLVLHKQATCNLANCKCLKKMCCDHSNSNICTDTNSQRKQHKKRKYLCMFSCHSLACIPRSSHTLRLHSYSHNADCKGCRSCSQSPLQ